MPTGLHHNVLSWSWSCRVWEHSPKSRRTWWVCPCSQGTSYSSPTARRAGRQWPQCCGESKWRWVHKIFRSSVSLSLQFSQLLATVGVIDHHILQASTLQSKWIWMSLWILNWRTFLTYHSTIVNKLAFNDQWRGANDLVLTCVLNDCDIVIPAGFHLWETRCK